MIGTWHERRAAAGATPGRARRFRFAAAGTPGTGISADRERKGGEREEREGRERERGAYEEECDTMSACNKLHTFSAFFVSGEGWRDQGVECRMSE